MDPAKRICLKNLPEDCTKREMAELVRARTGAQPHSIDLGLDAHTGKTRRYGHLSCEGARAVLEVLNSSGGVTLRDARVRAYAARPHYSHRLAAARRARDADAAACAAAREAAWQSLRERWQRRCDARGVALGELPPLRVCTPPSFYATRRRYAAVASAVAQRARAAHAAARQTQRQADGDAMATVHAALPHDEAAHAQRMLPPSPSATTTATATATRVAVTSPSHTARGQRARKEEGGGGHTRTKLHVVVAHKTTTPVTAAAALAAQAQAQAQAAETTTPPVRKTDRKLAGLQAKLAALKVKLLLPPQPSASM